MAKYTTEEGLGNFIKTLFLNEEIIIRKKLLGFFPDFYLPNLNLIIEYDGPGHYKNVDYVLRDKKKNKIMKDNDIKIIRIPYWLSFSKDILKLFINNLTNNENIYNNYYSKLPNGFWDKNTIFPGDYCNLGYERFLDELEYIYTNNRNIFNEIINTILSQEINI